MDIVDRIKWWLSREGACAVPAMEVGVSSYVLSLRGDMELAGKEIEHLRQQVRKPRADGD